MPYHISPNGSAGGCFSYSYDAAGNRLSKEDCEGVTEYHYNQKNQLILLDSPSGKKQFTYSRQGSILTEEGAEGTRRYVYNSRNQQIRVECENGAVQENYYDAEGLRHETLENEKLLRLVYHRGELLYEGGEREETSYYLGAGTEGIQRNGESFYYYQDEQLSEALMTDTGGRIQNHYQYDAFGAELNVMERIPNRIRYTGQQYDRLTEQYYLRARYYNPILGRFMQEDEYLGDGLNLYAYCENNPVMYYDPSGYSSYEAKVGSGIGDEGGSKGGTGVKKPYATSRPSYGKGQVEQVWENAKDPITGKVYDPSGVEITWDPTKPRNGQWDMGHIPGEKYSEMHQLYMDDVITKDEFLEWYRNPDNYRPELPSTNRSHKYE